MTNINTAINKTQIGIYKITNIKNGKSYIGQSKNLNDRIRSHRWMLRSNKHGNEYLQRSFNKYGEDNFYFEIIEECELDELNNKEIFWIDFFETTNRHFGYNYEGGGSDNKIIHEVTRKKISKAFKGKRTGKNNPMYGRKLTETRKKQISLTNRGLNSLLNERKAGEIKEKRLYGYSLSELAKEYNVNVTTISKVTSCVNWIYVKEHLNSRLIDEDCRRKREVREKIFKYYEPGMKAPELSNITGISVNVIRNSIGGYNEEFMKDRHEKIREDYNSGVSVKELKEKYNVSNSVIDYALPGWHEKERKLRNEKVFRMKSEGYKNKDIAKHLNIHRTTVSEILLKRSPSKIRRKVKRTYELEQKVLKRLNNNESKRSIAREESISRNMINSIIKDYDL